MTAYSMTEFTEVFWSFLISSVIGLVVIVAKQCMKSKCDDVSFCCNLIHVHRRVDLENMNDDHSSDEEKNMPQNIKLTKL